MFPLEDWEIEDEENLNLPDDSTKSVVTFEGAATGGLVISPSQDLLEALAANMLGSDEVTTDEKEGALCEMANIICGNTVPLFSKNKQICSILPPRILEEKENTDQVFKDMEKEFLRIYLDEGVADITLYYSN